MSQLNDAYFEEEYFLCMLEEAEREIEQPSGLSPVQPEDWNHETLVQ